MSAAPSGPPIYLDADACPVKDETYRVAVRYGLTVHVVANSVLNLPREPWIERVVVGSELDAADDWIAARAGPGTIVLTADVPLAARCVKAGATVLAFTGKPFSESSIGLALATRDLMQSLREAGTITGGPKPFSRADRSAFLSALDRAVNRILRDRPKPG
ncbi:YaiI/YqxD family protein [Methylobacterium sp. P1-11]|uniref:YaiI/YqxD family protein n=1 Tax=Methylobacterium sp. P1-11 TaxID=2024616 RepID=UPI0011EBA2E8|nr:YaiI/YqxD family protein [Methylobacterium sp. P1-11]KAA0122657.1 YaiI/YqxD family protein [Methylobacterium sp. P1-11]